MRAAILSIPILAAIIFGGAIACSISDADRCPSGYEWSNEYMSCLLIVKEYRDASVPIEDGGFGTPCNKDDDCADLRANYCVEDPTGGTDDSYCSLQDCVSGDCPGGWQCCDCNTLGWVVLCLDDGAAGEASAFGCSCAP